MKNLQTKNIKKVEEKNLKNRNKSETNSNNQKEQIKINKSPLKSTNDCVTDSIIYKRSNKTETNAETQTDNIDLILKPRDELICKSIPIKNIENMNKIDENKQQMINLNECEILNKDKINIHSNNNNNINSQDNNTKAIQIICRTDDILTVLLDRMPKENLKADNSNNLSENLSTKKKFQFFSKHNRLFMHIYKLIK